VAYICSCRAIKSADRANKEFFMVFLYMDVLN